MKEKKLLEELKCQYCAKFLGDFIRTDFGYIEIICCKKEGCVESLKKEYLFLK